MKKDLNIYYKGNHLFSYGCLFMLIIGARGLGKTYLAKKYLLKNYFRKGYIFCVLRDNINAIKELTDNNCNNFLKDIKKDPTLLKYFTEDTKIDYKNNILYINDKIAGYFYACSTFYNLKGNDLSDINTILYDEFIKEKTQNKRGNRALEFLNMVETIGRMRGKESKLRILLTANALDLGDDIINIFGFSEIKGYGYYLNRKKSAVLHYADNSLQFKESKLKSISGILTTDTAFADNLINNKFLTHKINLLIEKPKGLDFIAIFRNEDNEKIKLYYYNSCLYCERETKEDTYSGRRFVSNIKLVNLDYLLASDNFIKNVKNYFASNHIYFNSNYAYTIFKSIFI